MQDNLLENLNPEQLAAVTHDQGPLMIIAGAGTGKTTVITHRIGYLIEQKKAKPDEILALTFTDKAAAEMEERVDRLLPYGYVDLWISTFHAFCERILKMHALDIGIPNDFKLLSQTDAWLLVRQNFDRFNLNYYRPAGNPTKFIHALLQHFSRAKDENITPDEYLAYVEGLKANADQSGSPPNRGGAGGGESDTVELARLCELADAYHTYQQILLENGALDFGDLIAYTLKLFQKRPKILALYQQQFKYVLVDEFQDTNWAQYELVKMLAQPQNNLTIVGDDDQSVYKFRGASLSNILQFQADYPTAKKIVLTSNYRSGQGILDAAYNFIQLNNPNRLEAQLKESDSTLSKKLVSGRGTTGAVERMHHAALEDEVRAVIEKIKALRDAGVPLAEIAILVRANDSAEPFIAELERHGVPYQFMALKGLYRKPVILDGLALLRVIDHPFDSPSMFRVLSHPTIGVHPDDVAKLTHECYRHGKSLVEIMEIARTMSSLNPETSERCHELLTLFSKVRMDASRKPASEVFVDVVKASGLLCYVQTLSEREQQESFRLLQQLFERMRQFESVSRDRSLKRFLQELEHEQDSGDEGSLKTDPEEGPETVRIMTVHSSKGLEFGHVFIANMVDQRFPTRERKDAIPLPDALIKETIPEGDIHLEEERRLMYVALTRAKDAVYLTSAEDYGGARKKKPSRFIVEMGLETSEPKAPTKTASVAMAPNAVAARPAHFELPNAFSFTQLAAFDTCPLQYKYAHLLHVPVFGKYQMSFGKTMHGTLQHFFERYKERRDQPQQTLFDVGASAAPTVTLDELLKLYEENWIDEWYENDKQREEYRAKGRKTLVDYYAEVTAHPPRPLYLEKGFTLKFGDVVVRGRIDRVDDLHGGVEIIDYKTGKPKTELSTEDKRQLMLYQMAAEECFNPPLVPLKLTYHYLEDNSRLSFLAEPEELDALRQEMVETANRIRTSMFEATPGFMCSYCDFKDICPFRQL